jgi:hypothetical protein
VLGRKCQMEPEFAGVGETKGSLLKKQRRRNQKG